MFSKAGIAGELYAIGEGVHCLKFDTLVCCTSLP
jgi:hypothetical protein